MTESERWQRVLEAHAYEHQAMHDRGLSRIGIFGRPRGMGATVQMPEPFSPYSLHQVNLSPYQGLGALTDEQKVRWRAATRRWSGYATLGVITAVVVGAFYFATR